MCGHRQWISPAEQKYLDTLLSHEMIQTVRPTFSQLGPDDAFRLRTRTGMTQLDFARLVGVTPITVSRWERGTTKMSTAYAVLVKKVVDEYRHAKRK